MPEVVRRLSLLLDQSVIDKTGFTELFDLQLDFVPGEITPAMPPPPPDSACAASLRRIAPSVTVLSTGCCGMAGSFGFTADRYSLSMKVGELSLFPAVRAADALSMIAAPGTSCRHQIHDGTDRLAFHPMELWARALELG